MIFMPLMNDDEIPVFKISSVDSEHATWPQSDRRLKITFFDCNDSDNFTELPAPLPPSADLCEGVRGSANQPRLGPGRL